MSIEVLINKYKSTEWDKFIDTIAGHSLYHHIKWKEIIEKTFGHSSYYILVKRNGQLLGVLPTVHLKSFLFGNFLVSLPYFNYAGICAETRDAQLALLDKAIDLAKKLGVEFLELRHTQNYNLGLPVKLKKVTFFLRLNPNPEVLWKGLDPKVRNQIRKAQRSDCQVEIGGLNKLKDFYNVFSVNMRDLGTPVYPKRFFENMLIEFPDIAKIFIVKMKGKAVACGFTLAHHDVLELPWASSLRRYNRYCPNMLLYWEIIRYACQNGFSWFDFGRCSKGESTYKFKKQWGGEERQLYWHYWLREDKQVPEINPDNPKYRFFIAIWKRLPLWFTRLVGPHIVRNIP